MDAYFLSKLFTVSLIYLKILTNSSGEGTSPVPIAQTGSYAKINLLDVF